MAYIYAMWSKMEHYGAKWGVSKYPYISLSTII